MKLAWHSLQRIGFLLHLSLGVAGCRSAAVSSDEPPVSQSPGESANTGGPQAPSVTIGVRREKSASHRADATSKHRGPNGQARVAALEQNPWSTPESCEDELAAAHRLPREPGRARLASWNVHWFPDGQPGQARSEEKGTDLRWMACVITWMNVDALALQEVKLRSTAAQKLQSLVNDLERRTHSSWRVEHDECPISNGQHVVWLVDTARTQVTGVQQYDEINPEGSGCMNQLRPGLGVSLKFPGGLDVHAVAVHLKSGVTERDFTLRHQSWAALARVFDQAAQQTHDTDVLALGDFNSMGCEPCAASSTGAVEASELNETMNRAPQPAARVAPDLGCSHYYQREPGLLDHVVATRGMRELPEGARTAVQGYCRNLGCTKFSGKEPLAYLRLSDHCPITIDLLDQDLD